MRTMLSIPVVLMLLGPGLASAAIVLEPCYVKSYTSASDAGAPMAGIYTLALEERPGGSRGVLSRDGKILARDLPLEIRNCRDGKVRPSAEFRRSPSAAGITVLRMTGNVALAEERRARVCDLSVDVPLTAVVPQLPSRPNPGGPGQGGGSGNSPAAPPPAPQALAAPGGALPSRPNPGGPGQGSAAFAALPNLRIRDARVVEHGRAARQVKVKVINAGGGASAPTALKLFYVKGGVTTTASAAVPALAPNQQVWVTVDAGQPLAAAEKVYLRVDDPNTVAETSEGDNSFIFKG